VAEQAGGNTAVWLQYWFYYFYNDYNLIGAVIKAGLHECDWEMIQLRVPDGSETPDLAVYAQHSHAQSRDWPQVDLLPGSSRPIVYPARGSPPRRRPRRPTRRARSRRRRHPRDATHEHV